MAETVGKIIAPKKLIEVALPLDDINKAAAREKSIRHGHPSTLHLWWARRPLAAARAVIFSQMVNMPGWQHEVDGTVPTQYQKANYTKRKNKLFGIIRRLVQWENTNNEEVLKEAREEIWNSWRETCEYNKGIPGFDPEKLPAFHDPFAGGGALPLEAQRLGLESYASDLNPVAVMINKAMIEIPPKFANRPPVGPLPPDECEMDASRTWKGAEGLAEDVRRYGYWMREEAKKRIGHLYPKVEITADMAKERPDLKPYVGQKLTVIAWLWARTVKSPNPEFNDVEVPLVSSFVLSTKPGKEAYIELQLEEHGYRFLVKRGKPPVGCESGTKLGRGAKFKCVMSGAPIDEGYVRLEASNHRMHERLMAIVAEGNNERVFLHPVLEHETITSSAHSLWRPTAKMAANPRWFSPPAYGMTSYGEIFTNRQLCALNTFSDLVNQVRCQVREDAEKAGWDNDNKSLDKGGISAFAYGDALAVYLTFVLDKAANYWSNICAWHITRSGIKSTFGRQAVPMTWDFAECNPIGSSSGNWISHLDLTVEALVNFPSTGKGEVHQADAQTQGISEQKVVSTDPPYYDNIGYADLSDFFYAWMRPSLKESYPRLFQSITVPKADELVATPYRHGGKEQAEVFFMNGMTDAMRNLASIYNSTFPVTIYYAFKQSETGTNGTSNTGWETFLESLIGAGFEIRGTWPMRTELTTGLKTYDNVLASSVVLVCRRRSEEAAEISRSQFTRELRSVMFDALRDMTGTEQLDDTITDIAPVDLAQAAIGPGMGVYSKYKAVLKPDGSKMSVHEAMIEINKEIERVLDPDNASYDPSTNFFVNWFKEYGFEAGEFGKAEVLAKAKGTTVNYVVNSGVAESSGGKFRILHWEEYEQGADYDPSRDDNLPLWEAMHRVIRELLQTSTRKAAKLLHRMEGRVSADDIRQLAYYLYTFCERKGDATNARAYNSLVTSWSDIAQIVADLAAAEPPKVTQERLEI